MKKKRSSLSLFSLSLSLSFTLSLSHPSISLSRFLSLYIISLSWPYVLLSHIRMSLHRPLCSGSGFYVPHLTSLGAPRFALHPSGGQIGSREGRKNPYPSLGDGVMYHCHDVLIASFAIIQNLDSNSIY
jgi:hypothetical protein